MSQRFVSLVVCQPAESLTKWDHISHSIIKPSKHSDHMLKGDERWPSNVLPCLSCRWEYKRLWWLRRRKSDACECLVLNPASYTSVMLGALTYTFLSCSLLTLLPEQFEMQRKISLLSIDTRFVFLLSAWCWNICYCWLSLYGSLEHGTRPFRWRSAQ